MFKIKNINNYSHFLWNLQHPKWVLAKKIFLSFFSSLLSVIVISKLILANHIYVPGFFIIPQSIVYSYEETLQEWTTNSFVNFKELFVFVFFFFINVPLLIAAYFLIGKNYAKFAALHISIWIILGCILSLKAINDWKFIHKYFQFGIAKDLKRTSQISFYIISFLAGFLSGLINGIIWKQNLSFGGLDFIYTYLAIKKKKEIQKASLFVMMFSSLLSIVINEIGNADLNILSFLSLFISTMILSYTRTFLINYLYPKYKVITVLVITTKGTMMRNELLKFYRHGGVMMFSKGLYDEKDKTLLITAMTLLEKPKFEQNVYKIDDKAFLIGLSSDFIGGKFVF